MDILLDNLIKELEKNDSAKDLCAKALYPGVGIPQDYAAGSCGGMAFVQLVSASPTLEFPTPTEDVNNCTYTLAYSLVVGTIREVPVPEQGRQRIVLPSDEENTNTTYKQLGDMSAIHNAINNARDDIDLVLLGDFTSEGPEGGSLLSNWAVTVGNEDPD